MITAEQVKGLNKKIEELNAQGNRAKAKLEVLEGNLSQSLADYKVAYGVDLQGKSMKTTAANIQKELASVEAAVQEEFNLRNAVVAAIERGDISEASRLLGVTVIEESDDDEEEEVVAQPSTVTVGSTEDESGDFGFDEDDEDDGYGDLDGDGIIGEDDDVSPASFGFNLDSLNLDDDEEEEVQVPAPMPVTPPKASKPAKKAKSGSSLGSPVDQTVSELEGGFGNLELSDDDLEDFGFGDMLAGTKFSID